MWIEGVLEEMKHSSDILLVVCQSYIQFECYMCLRGFIAKRVGCTKQLPITATTLRQISSVIMLWAPLKLLGFVVQISSHSSHIHHNQWSHQHYRSLTLTW